MGCLHQLAVSGVNAVLNTHYRFTTVYNGGSRDFYVNGGNKVTGPTYWGNPFSVTDLMLGQNDNGGTEYLNGTVGMAYLRHSVLSDAWIAAEFTNLRTPTSFYTIT